MVAGGRSGQNDLALVSRFGGLYSTAARDFLAVRV